MIHLRRKRPFSVSYAVIWSTVTLMTIACFLPILNTLAVSLSSSVLVAAGKVQFFPQGFTLDSYREIISDGQFFTSFLVSLRRVLLGGGLNVLMMVLIAFPLSHTKSQFTYRTFYMSVLVFTMIFSGGLIPKYILMSRIGLLDTIWALVLPGAVSGWNCILLMNFFRALPRQMEEAAEIDGAQPFQILWKIYLPLSLPGLATVTLFSVVGHWNDFFDGLIYMNHSYNYPLSTYINTLVYSAKNLNEITDPEEFARIMRLSDATINSAKIFIAMIPVLLVYPFMQRYFVTGLVFGAVKE